MKGILQCLFSIVMLALLVPTAHAQDPNPGSLHTSPFPGFAMGAGKIANLAVGTSDDQVAAIALQTDGKILLVGSCSNGNNDDFCVARLNRDGTLDSSFVGPSGVANGRFLLPIGQGNDYAAAIALQPDGKIVIAGGCFNGFSDFDFCVTRLNADGSLDVSFSGPSGTGNGKFLLPIGGGNDLANSVVLQPDGKIVLAGYCSVVGNTAFCLARLSASGSLDASFDGPSQVGDGKVLLSATASFDSGGAAALQADGKILVAGHCWNGADDDFCVTRLNTNGTLDNTFVGPNGSANGKLLLAIGESTDRATAVWLQPDGKITLAGYCQNGGTSQFCVARLIANGAFDATFGGPIGDGGGKFLVAVGTTGARANALALQPDGKLLLAGICAGAINEDFCVIRLNSDGTLDLNFDGPNGNGNGKFAIAMGASIDIANALALQTDGRIVVAGGCHNGSNLDFCVARLNGGPFGAKNCSFDVDGDGKVLATTDMLIATRVALGISGSTILGGMTFAPHAARQTWPDIRDYLVNQCGMVIAP